MEDRYVIRPNSKRVKCFNKLKNSFTGEEVVFKSFKQAMIVQLMDLSFKQFKATKIVKLKRKEGE